MRLAVLSWVAVLCAASPAAAQVTASPWQLDFSLVHVWTPTQKTVVLTNHYASPVTIDSVVPYGTGAAVFSVDPAGPFTIAAGASATVSVTCAPHSVGVYDANLLITPHGLAPIMVEMYSMGGIAYVGVAPTSIDFGEVALGEYSSTVVGMKSADNIPITFDFTASDAAVVIDTRPTENPLQPGHLTKFNVAFAPRTVGVVKATVELTVAGLFYGEVGVEGVGVEPSGGDGAGGGCDLSGRRGHPSRVLLLLFAAALLIGRRRP